MPAPEPSAFVIDMAQTYIEGDGRDAAENFSRGRAMAFAGTLAPDFLATMLKICNRASFASDRVDRLGHREVEVPGLAGNALTLALNRADLRRWMEQATGRGPLRSVEGRVVQTRPCAGDRLRWHDDLNNPRRALAITINLSEQPYEGGEFELREAGSREILFRHRHTELGAALIFDVARGLEHRVLPLTSGGPRRVYIGWFLQDEAP